MSGGFYKPVGRGMYRVWFPWKGKKIFINKYLDGTALYHEAQAKRVLEKIRSEVDQGIFDPSLWNKDKALQFQNAWKVYMEQKPCGKDRMEARERIYNDFLLPYFKDKSLKEIEQIHIYECLGRVPKTYAPSYLRVIRATLRAFLTFHLVTRMKMFEFPIVKVPHKIPLWLSRNEQDKVFECIPAQHEPIFRFIRLYGCRSSEACNLRKSDIDWEKGIVTFRERKNNRENTLPLFEEIKSILRSGKVSHWELVFCTASGQKYTRQALYRCWVDASKKAGVKVIPLKNGTRHSLACQLFERGESSMTVSRILGNTPGVVEKSYAMITVKRVEEVLKINSQK